MSSVELPTSMNSEQLLSEIDRLKKIIETMKNENETMKNDIDTLKNENESLKNENKKLSDEVKELEEANDRLFITADQYANILDDHDINHIREILLEGCSNALEVNGYSFLADLQICRLL